LYGGREGAGKGKSGRKKKIFSRQKSVISIDRSGGVIGGENVKYPALQKAGYCGIFSSRNMRRIRLR